MQTVIGLDLGRSALKLVASWKDGAGAHRTRLSFPSAVAPARRLVGAEELRAAQTETVVVDGQAFFAFEPGLEVELSVVGPLRVGFGGSYLFTSDISLPETPPDVLRTAMARMTLKFGSF